MLNGQMSTTRLVVSVVIMVGCFTVIYPRFFHPIVLKLLGMQPAPAEANDHRSFPHRPPKSGAPHPGDSPHIRHDDIKRHMRPGPHPGMRAAAEMNNQKHGGGRGGVMGVVLPMYAVGIVVYLVYTLFKVFNKQGKGDMRRQCEREKEERQNTKVNRGNIPPYPKTAEEASEQLDNIEDTLNSADDKKISEQQMLQLQKRLQETEAQMATILKAMQNMSKNVETVSDDAVPDKKSPETEKSENRSNDSSPDISSYEVIKKNKGSGNSNESSPEVETIKASEVSKSEMTEDAEDNKEETLDDQEESEEKEDILLDSEKKEEDEDESSVRKRKAHTVTES